jgi:hypothetical protein
MAHHAKLIPKSSQLFNAVFYGNEIGTKDRGLNGCLFLRNPVNQSHITEDTKTSAGASDPFVPCMVTVTHHADVDIFAQRLRYVHRDSFYVTVKFGPIKLWK